MRTGERGFHIKGCLDIIYERYNNRELVPPDPLEFLYHYTDKLDMEIAGIVASSLAYGRVNQINRSVSKVMGLMGPSPYHFLMNTPAKDLNKILAGFKHRFTTADELCELLSGIRSVMARFGSLEGCFVSGFKENTGNNILQALAFFVEEVRAGSSWSYNSLLPAPLKGSACKRLNLFLRWMVRKDAVDPGLWTGISPSHLIVPLDTHLHRIGRYLGFTDRAQGSMKTAMEITEAFSCFSPEDPVRYDFALARMGMEGKDISSFMAR